MSRATPAALAAALLLALLPSTAAGAARDGLGNFQEPIYLASDPQDSGRLLVAERRGLIYEVRGAERTIWADLRALVLCCEGERGLLSIAPAPDFHYSDRIYVAYTGGPAAGGLAGDVQVDSFRHTAGTLVRAPILSVPHSLEPDDNGGQLQFGPENALYASFGDGGGSGDPFDSAQNLERLLGKLIRVYPYPDAEPPYVVPADNPLVGKAAKDEIWSLGLRNPRRFSFDRESGDLVIADAGENAREEIDLAPRLAGKPGGADANYGWDCREGLIEFSGDASEACGLYEMSAFTEPIFDYPHEDPQDGSAHGCSIVGGYVVRDASVPELSGRYLYGDYCLGEIRSIDLSAVNPRSTDRPEPALGVAPLSLFSFGEDSCGRVYIVTRSEVDRVVGTQPNPCGHQPPPPPPEPPLPPRTVVKLRALYGRPEPKILFKARVRPCAANRGRLLILKRGSLRFGAKRVKGRCVVKFRALVKRRAVFLALLPLGRGVGTIRSRRVVVHGTRR